MQYNKRIVYMAEWCLGGMPKKYHSIICLLDENE